MKYYLIAGEASGDLHGSNLVKALSIEDPQAIFRGFGGDHMIAAGVEIVQHIRGMDFMGFVEVVSHLPDIYRLLNKGQRDILDFKPDVLILIDYPGFNLKMAAFAKKHGIKVIYYISPQIWAWNTSRVHHVARITDRIITILPFEKDFYSGYGYDVAYVGHPLLDVLSVFTPPLDFKKVNGLNNSPIIALLPGSRKQEIKRMLPVMLTVARRFPEYQFVVGAARSVAPGFIESLCKKENLKIISGQTYALLSNAHAAIVTSGTASLETALLDVPQVIVYKGNLLSYYIAHQLVKVSYIGLPNLILQRPVVKELIQHNFNPHLLYDELDCLVTNEFYRQTMKKDYQALREKLGGAGASKRAAHEIINLLNHHKDVV